MRCWEAPVAVDIEDDDSRSSDGVGCDTEQTCPVRTKGPLCAAGRLDGICGVTRPGRAGSIWMEKFLASPYRDHDHDHPSVRINTVDPGRRPKNGPRVTLLGLSNVGPGTVSSVGSPDKYVPYRTWTL